MTNPMKVSAAPAGSIVEILYNSYGETVSSGVFYRIDGYVREYDGKIKVWERFNQGSKFIHGDNPCQIVNWDQLKLEGF